MCFNISSRAAYITYEANLVTWHLCDGNNLCLKNKREETNADLKRIKAESNSNSSDWVCLLIHFLQRFSFLFLLPFFFLPSPPSSRIYVICLFKPIFPLFVPPWANKASVNWTEEKTSALSPFNTILNLSVRRLRCDWRQDQSPVNIPHSML